MKVFALVLLCAFAAVQGRSAVSNKNSLARAELGEYPWVVHLRIAVSTSGFLESCTGSLIDNSWVLTTATCLENARFVWVRYGAVNVINPSLVTESSAVRVHPSENVALVSINRFVQTTDNIAPIALSTGELPASGTFCGYGANEAGNAGEILNCFDVSLEQTEDNTVVASGDGAITKYDVGAPVASEGVQVGIVSAEDGSVLNVADYVEWIESETGLELSRKSQPDPFKLIIVN